MIRDYSYFPQNRKYYLGNTDYKQSYLIRNSAGFVAKFFIQFIVKIYIFLLLDFLISLFIFGC